MDMSRNRSCRRRSSVKLKAICRMRNRSHRRPCVSLTAPLPRSHASWRARISSPSHRTGITPRCHRRLPDLGSAAVMSRGEKTLTAELQQAEDKFRALLEAAPDAIVAINEHGRITLVNSQTERLFGYEPGEIIGEPIEILVPQRFRGGHAAHRDGFITEPRVRPMGEVLTLYGSHKDGSEFP